MQMQTFAVGDRPWRFGTTDTGRPYAVATDVARTFDYASAKDATRQLDDDEKGRQIVPTPGGSQQMTVIYEDGLWELIFLSRKPEAKAIKKRVKDVLRQIRETGRYDAPQNQGLGDELAELEHANQRLSKAIAIARDERGRREVAETQAAQGVQFRTAIEAGDGLRPRDFHKKYFSDITDRAFFDHLYAKGYLIDQRGKGGYGSDGKLRSGPDHGRPGFKGKHFFYLHNGGVHGGKRREHTRVRPGQAELDFKARLIADGLVANTNTTGQLSIEEGAA